MVRTRYGPCLVSTLPRKPRRHDLGPQTCRACAESLAKCTVGWASSPNASSSQEASAAAASSQTQVGAEEAAAVAMAADAMPPTPPYIPPRGSGVEQSQALATAATALALDANEAFSEALRNFNQRFPPSIHGPALVSLSSLPTTKSERSAISQIVRSVAAAYNSAPSPEESTRQLEQCAGPSRSSSSPKAAARSRTTRCPRCSRSSSSDSSASSPARRTLQHVGVGNLGKLSGGGRFTRNSCSTLVSGAYTAYSAHFWSGDKWPAGRSAQPRRGSSLVPGTFSSDDRARVSRGTA